MIDMEIINCMMTQIEVNGEVTLSQAAYFLKVALTDVESKKDLCDGDIEIIKGIRQMLKGL